MDTNTCVKGATPLSEWELKAWRIWLQFIVDEVDPPRGIWKDPAPLGVAFRAWGNLFGDPAFQKLPIKSPKHKGLLSG